MLKRFGLFFSPLLVAGLAVALTSGCSSRTSAATQTTPAAFAPASSDAKAVEVIDQMITKLGGAVAWEAMKQLQFEMVYSLDGEEKGRFIHSWDRWNGRHRFEQVDMATVAKSKAEGDPSIIKSLVVMYDLFSKKGHVSYGGQEADSAEKKKRIEAAYERWKDDVYKVVFAYKSKDPGVVLKYKEQIKSMDDLCQPSCHVVQVTFSDGVGTDTYYLNINETSMIPVVWQKEVGGGRLGFKIEGWTDAGGLKFPAKLQNLGVKGEVFTFSGVKVGDPDSSLYIPQVR